MPFLPYVDKENVAVSSRARITPFIDTPRPTVKRFDGGVIATPRRALGDVNAKRPAPRKSTLKQPVALRVAGKVAPPSVKRASALETEVGNTKLAEIAERPSFDVIVPQREETHIYEDAPDDFDDIWSVAERPSTHLARILDWPCSMLPSRGGYVRPSSPLYVDNSDMFCDLSLRDDISSVFDDHTSTLEDSWSHSPSLDNIPLPPINELFLSDCS